MSVDPCLSMRHNEAPDESGQSGQDPHPENTENNAPNFHFISSLSRCHDMSRSQPQKCYTMSRHERVSVTVLEKTCEM